MARISESDTVNVTRGIKGKVDRTETTARYEKNDRHNTGMMYTPKTGNV